MRVVPRSKNRPGRRSVCLADGWTGEPGGAAAGSGLALLLLPAARFGHPISKAEFALNDTGPRSRENSVRHINETPPHSQFALRFPFCFSAVGVASARRARHPTRLARKSRASLPKLGAVLGRRFALALHSVRALPTKRPWLALSAPPRQRRSRRSASYSDRRNAADVSLSQTLGRNRWRSRQAKATCC